MTLQDQLQRTLGDAYVITRELGGGGMSRVFVARDTTLNREVAVKVLPQELSAGVNVDRFRREILLAAQLQHPNIVPVLSAGETDGLPFYSMPFVQGESLRARLARGPLAINDALSLLREVARALAYAHERGVVHRDIKPDNILLSGGSAVVADFGIAKALSASRTETPGMTLTQVGTSIGTPTYMAPEQAAGDPDTDHRADLYALGCVAYEVLAGRPPFVEKSPHKLMTAHMTETPAPVSSLRPDVPRTLSDLVAAMLAKSPADRPQSADDVIRVLDSATSATGQPAMPAILMGGPGALKKALFFYALAFVAVAIVAKAAIVGVGLPDWVFPGALIMMALGLPVILFTGYTHYATRRALVATPTFTPGGSPSMVHGTMATIALKASPHLSWKRTMMGGWVAAGGFVLLVGGYMLLRAMGIGPAGSLLASGRISARDQLVLADFNVTGGDSTIGNVIGEAVRTDLGQSDLFTIVPPTVVAGALARMQKSPATHVDLAIAREIAQREGAKAVLAGDVAPLGSGFIISMKLVSADSGLTLASFRQTADSPKDLLNSLSKLTHDLRGKMGESLRKVQGSAPLEQATTANLDALRAFALGVRANNIFGDYEKSAAYMRQAIAFDSTFASAWRSLGIALRNGRHPSAETDPTFVKAFQYREKLPVREKLLVEAEYWNGPGGDRAKAANAFEQMLARDPNDIAANNNLGLLEANRRHFERADTLYYRVAKATQGVTALGNLMRNSLTLGKYAVAESVVTVAEKNFNTFPSRVLRPVLYYANHQFDSAEKAWTALRGSPNPGAKQTVLINLRSLAMLRGHLDEANRIALASGANATANKLDASPLDPAVTMATNAGWFAEQPARAVAILDSALAATPLRTLDPNLRHDFDIATAYARAGRPDKARGVIAAWETDIRDTTARRELQSQRHAALAEIAMAERKGTEAVQELHAADRLPDGPATECEPCVLAPLGRAFDLANMPDSAIATMEKYVGSTFWNRHLVDRIMLAGTHKRLGELYEAKGQKDKAISHYTTFIELWKTADPVLQPKVAEVRKRLRTLEAGERR